jgi:hypothetical protein
MLSKGIRCRAHASIAHSGFTEQVSIPSDLYPQTQRSIGEALEPFRSEGVLIISGGLTIHTFVSFVLIVSLLNPLSSMNADFITSN